jgi:hypothetical protein
MDQPQRFEGPAWDGVVSDESCDQKPGLDKTVRPAIDGRLGWWWMIGVPKRQGVGAARFRGYCERGLRGTDGWATFSWPSEGIMPQSAIEDAKRDLDEKDFNEQYRACWENMGGAAFYSFSDEDGGNVRTCNHDPMRPILVGSDFNVNPMAWVLAHKSADGLGLEIFDELWITDTNTQAALDRLWRLYGEKHNGGWLFHGDATAQARHTSASSSDYAQLKNDRRFKAKVFYPAQNPGRKNRASSCNALLKNAAGERRCWIDPRCTHLIADLKERGLDASGAPAEGKSGDPIGHISDAWGYLVHWYWPSTRIDTGAKPSIGVYHGE